MIHIQSDASGVTGAFWDAGIPTSPSEFTRNPWPVLLQLVNFMACKLYSNKTTLNDQYLVWSKNNKTSPVPRKLALNHFPSRPKSHKKKKIVNVESESCGANVCPTAPVTGKAERGNANLVTVPSSLQSLHGHDTHPPATCVSFPPTLQPVPWHTSPVSQLEMLSPRHRWAG